MKNRRAFLRNAFGLGAGAVWDASGGGRFVEGVAGSGG